MNPLGSEEQLAPLIHPSKQEELYEQAIRERAKDAPPCEPSRSLFEVHDQLKSKFGDGCVSLGESQLTRHGTDLSLAVPQPTGLVFYPEEGCQVAWLLECLPDGMAVVPYGKGTSTEAQTIPNPARETISIDMQRMRRILSYNRQDMRITVEAGLDLYALNQVLAEDGLWFPVDSMANASIGGMAAGDAEGISAHLYGRMDANVTELKVVLADGHVASTSEHSPLMHMFIGSEGSLGVITELTLRLQTTVRRVKTVSMSFSRLEEAALAIPTILRDQEGLIACFLLDCGAIRALGAVLVEYPTILLQLDHDRPLCGVNNTIDVQEWIDEGLQRMLWSSLSNIWLCTSNRTTATTVTVPPSKIAELARQYHPDGMLTGSCFANGATGTVTFIRPQVEVKGLRDELFPAVRRLGGSVGGYGTGIKRDWGEDTTLWSRVKQALDPRNILSP